MPVQAPFIFGRYKGNITPQKTSYMGMNNYWTVPSGWFMKSNPNVSSEMIASPNADFSAPVYYCTLDDSYQNWCFTDTLLGSYTHQNRSTT
jgi:hypothetical protein